MPTEIVVPALTVKDVTLTVRGTSPLIMHKWSEKAKKEMLDKQQKRAKPAKEAKDPQRDYEESIYHHENGGYGFPSVAFKAAIVRAGTYSDMKMTHLRGAVHVLGETSPVHGEPKMREDMVRVGMGTADIRYRAEFVDWSAVLSIHLNERALSVEQLVHLTRVAGFAVGVGEWRPERDGQFGRFDVDTVEVA